MEVFQFFKFHENETKHDKHNFMRGLIVIFEVFYWKNWLKTLQAHIFVWLNNQVTFTKIFKYKRSNKVWKSINPSLGRGGGEGVILPPTGFPLITQKQ